MGKVKLAMNLARAGRTDEALTAYGELIDASEELTQALGHRAWLLKGVGRYEESLQDYDRLLALNPDDSEAARQRADTLRRLGRAREALDALLVQLRKDPLDAAAARLLAECQEAAGAASVPPAPTLPSDPPPPVRPLNSVLDQLEREPSNYPASSFPEVGRVLYTLVRCLRPALMAETGCYVGYSTLCIAQAMEENGGGHLHSFDLFPSDWKVDSPVAGPGVSILQAARAHVERAGLGHRVTLHQGDSASGITQTFSGGKESQPLDLAFIDGDHTVKGCLKDFLAVDPLLKPGGVILLHDTVPERCSWAGPRYLMEQLPERSRGVYQCINLPSPEGFGLGILQKSGGKLVGPWRPPLVEMLAERLLPGRSLISG